MAEGKFNLEQLVADLTWRSSPESIGARCFLRDSRMGPMDLLYRRGRSKYGYKPAASILAMFA